MSVQLFKDPSEKKEDPKQRKWKRSKSNRRRDNRTPGVADDLAENEMQIEQAMESEKTTAREETSMLAELSTGDAVESPQNKVENEQTTPKAKQNLSSLVAMHRLAKQGTEQDSNNKPEINQEVTTNSVGTIENIKVAKKEEQISYESSKKQQIEYDFLSNWEMESSKNIKKEPISVKNLKDKQIGYDFLNNWKWGSCENIEETISLENLKDEQMEDFLSNQKMESSETKEDPLLGVSLEDELIEYDFLSSWPKGSPHNIDQMLIEDSFLRLSLNSGAEQDPLWDIPVPGTSMQIPVRPPITTAEPGTSKQLPAKQRIKKHYKRRNK